jgi:hypothetical protein
MWVRGSTDYQQQLDPEWITEFASFLDKRSNKEKLSVVKKIFVEVYLENVREGMNPKEALRKAKSIALCFYVLQR